jgi:hypothetical protein
VTGLSGVKMKGRGGGRALPHSGESSVWGRGLPRFQVTFAKHRGATSRPVIPANAGIQSCSNHVDPGFRRGDVVGLSDFPEITDIEDESRPSVLFTAIRFRLPLLQLDADTEHILPLLIAVSDLLCGLTHQVNSQTAGLDIFQGALQIRRR